MTWSLLKDTWRTLRGWETIFWSDKTQLEHCGLNAKYHIWRKPDTAHQLANTIPKLKHGGGSIKLGDVFQQWDTSYGQGKVNPAMFRSTLDPKRAGPQTEAKVHQQDNNPKQRAMIPKQRLQNYSVNVPEWPSQTWIWLNISGEHLFTHLMYAKTLSRIILFKFKKGLHYICKRALVCSCACKNTPNTPYFFWNIPTSPTLHPQ